MARNRAHRAAVTTRAAILIAVLAAAWLRLPHLGWDGGYSLHPDERSIVFVAESLPETLNPYRTPGGERRAYAYGHLPLYATAFAERAVCALRPAWCAETFRFDRLRITARMLSALADLGTVALAGMLASQFGGWRAAGIAAGMVALSPLHIQNATYGTVDGLLAFFCTLAVLVLVRFVEGPSRGWALAAGVAAGLALSVKISAGVLLVPLVVALWPAERQRYAGWAFGAMGAAFMLTSPFALLDAGQFLTNVSTQAAVTSGRLEVWFTAQYRGTLPVIYVLGQMGHWGTGWAAVTLGMVALVWLSTTQLEDARLRVVLAWVWAGLLVASVGMVKFPRYMLMASPAFFAVVAVWASSRRGWLQAAVAVAIIGGMGVRAAALDRMYAQPHPWVVASRWVYDTLPARTVLLSEERDDALPLAFEREGLLREWQFATAVLPLWEGETPAAFAEVLAEGEVLIISTRRGYGAIPRVSGYPVTSAYYEALFAGELGYTLTRTFERYTTAGPLAFVDAPCAGTMIDCPAPHVDAKLVYSARLDESFVVYDHPRVLVFENTELLPADVLRQRIEKHLP